ncbi:hypothetical protein VW23_022630 [Devosia insulae DS-56]|uniref:Uncharacterized protein n=1 Tax=Devosia insulae DS-56 TaxID=1116389 RepID=A0A1E5XNM6_9HYPH|nr:hypothetical protein [Devosia insulae]OEO30181.1 hypothetical protein VW23_022630 [Devosia insulae DS-56]
MLQQLIRASLIAATLGIASGLATAPARAEMVVVAAGTLTPAEQQLVEQNPALTELAGDPEMLRAALDLIATALANPSNTRGGLDDLDATDVKLLGQNPALLQVWRSSPEASADLLQLIRTAAGGSKPK